MGPEALAQVLRPLAIRTHPDLIVGLQTSDDAAVFRVSGERAIIQTIDFFTPIVDDPYTYGSIAAANSMSDVYAMGGDVLFALNVVAFPEDLDSSILSDIMRGGSEKVAEAGGVIAGGHTVTDAEPKYGLVVTGFVHPDRVWRKAGAGVGDNLFLTKPIGTGLVATAIKDNAAQPAHVAAAVDSMTTLNKLASEVARGHAVSACTDITGFGLLGHALEMAERGPVRFRLQATQVPILPGAVDYARTGHVPGGLMRNRRYFESTGVRIGSGVDPDLVNVLFDPQTSGGLLFAIPSNASAAFSREFAERGLPLWQIGAVEDGSGVIVDR